MPKLLAALATLLLVLAGAAHAQTSKGVPVNVKRDYGAVCNGTANDTVALQNAFNAAGASEVQIPNSTCLYTTLTINHPVRIVGQTAADGSTGSSVLQSTDATTANKITIGNGSVQLNGVMFENLDLTAPNSTGGAVLFFDDASDTGTSRVQMYNLGSTAYGVLSYQVNAIHFDHMRINNPQTACWKYYSGSGTTGRTDDMEMDDDICLGQATGGGGSGSPLPTCVEMDGNVNTLVGHHFNCVDPGKGLWIHDDVGATSAGNFATLYDFEVDFPNASGVEIDSGTGYYFSDIYCQGAATAPCFEINYNATASDTVGDISITGGKIVNSRVSTNLLINGVGVRVTGVNFAGGGIFATGTVPGVEIGAHAANVTFTGNTSGTVSGLEGETATYGVQIDSGAEFYVVADNDLSGNVTGSFLDNSGAPNVSAGSTVNNLGGVVPNSNGSSVPLTGFSLNLGTTGASPLAYANYAIFPAGTLATGTFLFPAGAYNTEQVSIFSSQTVTALTLTPGAGDAISPSATTIAAGHTLRYIYNLANKVWVQFGS